jgi:hypothetical protein
MAINFPNSPSIGDVFTDTTSGFSYEWTGSLWKSFSAGTVSNIQILDDISSSFNNSLTTFNLTVGSSAVSPANAQQIEIILGGIQQAPGVDYTISGSTVVFTTEPSNGLTFSGKLLGTALSLNTIAAGTDGSGLVSVPAGELTGALPAIDGSALTNVTSGVGIKTAGGLVGYGATILDFRGAGLSTVTAPFSGISTVNIVGGGGGGAGVSSTGILTCRGIANSDDITESITLDDFYGAGTNYAMVGPITVVGSGVTVTVGSGVSYVIV